MGYPMILLLPSYFPYLLVGGSVLTLILLRYWRKRLAADMCAKGFHEPIELKRVGFKYPSESSRAVADKVTRTTRLCRHCKVVFHTEDKVEYNIHSLSLPEHEFDKLKKEGFLRDA